LKDFLDPQIEQLSPQQYLDFRKAIFDGRLSKEIEIWKPWWTVMVYELNKGTNLSPREISDSQKIVPLKNLTPGKPSPSLPYNLLEIL
jgi:hypothetical protein